MVSGRPLLYLSLPGVAFLLGVFWYRRRNKNRADNTDDELPADKVNDHSDQANEAALPILKANGVAHQNGKLPNGKGGHRSSCSNNAIPTSPTKSLNINGSLSSQDGKESPNTLLFGKSAPIRIQHNGRSSPGKHAQQVDSEILASRLQDAGHEKLCSIDEDFENLSSPRIADSVNNRPSFYNRKTVSQTEEPVVIKANCTPKISPENSFLESKYSKECEQNNNCDNDNSNISNSDDNGNGNGNHITENTENIDNKVKNNRQSKAETQTKSQPIAQLSAQLSAMNTSGKAAGSTFTAKSESETELGARTEKEIESEAAVQVVPEVTAIDGTAESNANGNQERNVDAASPSLSICSVQSGDSGTGSSLPRSEPMRAKRTYAFYFPTRLTGSLYGRKQTFINQIKSTTNVSITLSEKGCAGKVCVCKIEGTDNEIEAALAIIRQRFPVKCYPNFTMDRIHYALPQTIVPLSNESRLSLQLKLIEGINNDVIVSYVHSGGHLFVQHPLHPSHPSLPILQKSLYDSYSSMEAPLLPNIEISAVCVTRVNDIWYRVQIMDVESLEEQRCLVKFLDFGGYMSVHLNDLRQIRTDFMVVPFQATECILSNLEPIGDDWSVEAGEVLDNLTKGIVLQAQVAGYNSSYVPEIYLYASLGPNRIVFINRELAARNLARWVDME